MAPIIRRHWYEPDAKYADPQFEIDEMISLAIVNDKIYLNHEIIDISDIDSFKRELNKIEGNKKIALRICHNVIWGLVTPVLNEIKKIGKFSVVLVTSDKST